MVIEWLKFRVPPQQREKYIQIDEEIWTAALQTYPGFVSKETWISLEEEDAVIFVIRWRTQTEWKAIPEDELANIEARFDDAIGFDYTMEESKAFQVRRFPVTGESPS